LTTDKATGRTTGLKDDGTTYDADKGTITNTLESEVNGIIWAALTEEKDIEAGFKESDLNSDGKLSQSEDV